MEGWTNTILDSELKITGSWWCCSQASEEGSVYENVQKMYFGTHQPWTVHTGMEGDIYTETLRKRRQAGVFKR